MAGSREIHPPGGTKHAAFAEQGVKRDQKVKVDGVHGTQLYTLIIALEIMTGGTQFPANDAQRKS
jgi:hypothetical protein